MIVGGGFAGVTPARELTMRGRRAVLLAVRDRLGGRTYTADHDRHQWNSVAPGCTPSSRTLVVISRNGMETETFPVLWAVARTCGAMLTTRF